MPEGKKNRFFYGYTIVLAGFVTQFMGWSVVQTFGVFFNPLLDEFGWTRTMISGAVSINFILYGFSSMLAGRLGDSFGPRLVLTVCGVFVGLGCLMMSQISIVWQLYLAFGLIVAIGISGTDVVVLSTIARWFVKKRGIMTGIAKVGTGATIFIMPLVVRWLISSYGWRISYIILGSAVLVLLVLVAQLFRRDPGKMGLAPDGVREEEAGNLSSENTGLTLREVLRTRQFWMLCSISLFICFCTHTTTIHIVPHAIELGMPAMSAAGVLSAIGGISIMGRLVMGNVGDRIGNRMAMIICYATMALSLFWLQIATGEAWMLYLFGVLYGFAHGAFFTLISPIVAELFGLRAQGVILGIVIFSGTLGGSVGPLLAGNMFDITGTYLPAYLICAFLAVMALVFMLLLRPIVQKA